jgi:hypothetical protein
MEGRLDWFGHFQESLSLSCETQFEKKRPGSRALRFAEYRSRRYRGSGLVHTLDLSRWPDRARTTLTRLSMMFHVP